MRRRYLALSLLSLAAWSSPAEARSLTVSPGKLAVGGTFVVSSTREPRDETECKVTVVRPSGGTSTVSCQGGTGVATEPGVWRFSLIVYVSTQEAKDGYVTLTTALTVTPAAAASATATAAPPASTAPAPATVTATAAKGPAATTTSAKAPPARSSAGKAAPAGDPARGPVEATSSGAAAAKEPDPVVLGIGLGVLLLVLAGLGLGLKAYSKGKARAQAAAQPAAPPPDAHGPASVSPPTLVAPGAPPPVKPRLEPKLVLGPLKLHPTPGAPPLGPQIAGPEWSFMVRLPPPVITSTPIAEGENTETT